MNGVMDALRSGTAAWHDQAESQEFQRRMAAGELSRTDYISWLSQMLHVHEALETAVAARLPKDPRFAPVVADHFKAPLLRADLEALSAAVEGSSPATRRLVARIEELAETDPLRLLGFYYVLEGSMNGNRILARRLVPRLGLRQGEADRYLDPYGASQRETWAVFKLRMEEVGFDAAERQTLVEGARELFAAIAELSADLAQGVASS